MEVLVIGSKGFIGSHLAAYLSKKDNYEVYECDVVVDYQNKNYIVIDAANSDFHTIFLDNKFDICINCSGAASVPDSIIHPLRDYLLNTYNLFKILDAIRLYQPNCKFINLSSAAVYGNPQRLPVSEDFAPAPISPYGIHKVQAEVICKEFFDYYGINTCYLRIFSAYGIGLRKQLMWDLNRKFSSADEVVLFGTGNESRDFINIKDIVEAIYCCMHNAGFNAEPINVANGEEIKVKEIADIFSRYIGGNKKITFTGTVKEGDPLFWKADISLLQSMGYIPKVGIEEGIADYVNWAKTI